MIIFKTWMQIKKLQETKFRYAWSGWFLLGVIPLYLRRYDIDQQGGK